MKKWMYLITGILLGVGILAWVNESTLRHSHILNSMLAAIVVFVIFITEVTVVREAKAPFNPITMLTNVVVCVFPLINIALYSWPLAAGFLAGGGVMAWLLIRGRQALLSAKTR